MSEQEITSENRLQRVGDMVVNREVLLCLSAPLEEWIHNNPNDFPEWCENLYTNPDSWTAGDCADWLEERGIDLEIDADLNVTWGIVEDDDECREGLQDLVRDNSECAEVFEWWAVSSWLAEYLRENGHVMLDWYGIDVWGRETTGQAIKMDGVIRDFIQAKELIASGWGAV